MHLSHFSQYSLKRQKRLIESSVKKILEEIEGPQAAQKEGDKTGSPKTTLLFY